MPLNHTLKNIKNGTFCYAPPFLVASPLSSSTFSLTHPSPVLVIPWPSHPPTPDCPLPSSQAPLLQLSILHASNLWGLLVHRSYCQSLSHADSMAEASRGYLFSNSKVRKQEQLQEKVLLFSLVPAPGHLYLGADVLSPPTGHTAHCLQRHLLTVPLKQPCSCSRTLCTYSDYGVKLKLLCWDLWPFQFGMRLSAAVCHHSLPSSLCYSQVELLQFLMHAYPG